MADRAAAEDGGGHHRGVTTGPADGGALPVDVDADHRTDRPRGHRERAVAFEDPDLVAGLELPAAGPQHRTGELARGRSPGPGQPVEMLGLVGSEGDHRRRHGTGPGLMPVGHQPVDGVGNGRGHSQPAVATGGDGISVDRQRRSVGAQLDRAQSLSQAGKGAAGRLPTGRGAPAGHQHHLGAPAGGVVNEVAKIDGR